MPKLFRRLLLLSGLTCTALALSGCAAIATETEHHDMEVNSAVSQSIFLPIGVNNNHQVYLQINNISGQPGFKLNSALQQDLKKQGWQVVNSPEYADIILQVKVVNVGQTSKDAINESLADGVGGDVIEAGAGALITHSVAGAIGGGIIGDIGSFVADSAVKDVIIAATTDIQLQARQPDYQLGWHTYQTRLVVYANKVNLTLPEAEPVLIQHTAQRISKII